MLHTYLFGVELTDTVIVLTDSGNIYFLSSKKKIQFLEQLKGAEDKKLSVKFLTRNKSDSNGENFEILWKEVEKCLPAGEQNIKIGVFQKEWETNGKAGTANVSGWQKKIEDSNSEVVDVNVGFGMLMSVKDEEELDLVKKSSVLGNKILKHGFIPRLEDIIDKEESVTHEALADEMEEIYADPKKIKLNVPPEQVQSAYFPIIQSGGDYDLRVSAFSNQKKMKFDIVTVSLGSRYQTYCSNIARTFLVDPPKSVSDTYETLVVVHEACLAAMIPGNSLKAVYAAAVKKLKDEEREDLIECLPKNLGFSIGAYFREGNLTLSPKNNVLFKAGMTFNLCVGFSGVKLSSSDKADANEKSPVGIFHLSCESCHVYVVRSLTPSNGCFNLDAD